jgi:hypothetical protein
MYVDGAANTMVYPKHIQQKSKDSHALLLYKENIRHQSREGEE